MRVASWLGRRIIRASLLLAGASFLSFALMEAAPGDYFEEVLLNPAASRQTIEALRMQYGLSYPMPVRYLAWCASVARGEWGMSIAYQRPAGPVLRERALNTFLLTSVGTVFAWAGGLGAAVWAALGGAWRQRLLLGVAAILAPLPDVVLTLGLMVIAAKTGWLPTGGMSSPDYAAASALRSVSDTVAHLVLPVLALSISLLPLVLLHARSAIMDLLTAPFIVSARASGIPRFRVVVRHILPAASNPLITVAGFSVGGMLSSSLVIEVITGWPGLGSLMLQSILRRDPYMVLGAITASAALFLLANLAADICLFMADPTIRTD